MKWLVITVTLFSMPSLMAMNEYAQLPSHEVELTAQQETKKRHAQENASNDNGTKQSHGCFKFFSGCLSKIKRLAKKRSERDLEDACAIFFGDKNNAALAQTLQKLIFGYLQDARLYPLHPKIKLDPKIPQLYPFNQTVDLNGEKLKIKIRSNHTIDLCDSDGLPIHTFKGHKAQVTCCMSIIDNHGKQLFVSGSEDKTIKLWDPANNSCLYTLVGHEGSVRCLSSIMENGVRLLASGSDDKTVRYWDLNNGDCLRMFPKREDSVSYMVPLTHPDGHQLLAFSYGWPVKYYNEDDNPVYSSVYLTEAINGCQAICITNHDTEVVGLETIIIDNKEFLSIGYKGGTIRRWGICSSDFEQAVIEQRNFENAQQIMHTLSNADSQGKGLPKELQQLVAEYAAEK